MEELKKVKKASLQLKNATTELKNKILENLIQQLEIKKEEIFKANKIDLENDIPSHMKDRLLLNESRIESMIVGLKQIINLEDPIQKVLSEKYVDNGMIIKKVSIPFGVIAIIYESRPNVTIDCAALCIKTGNACILKGGKEALNTNKVLVDCLKKALSDSGMDDQVVHLIESSNRDVTLSLMQATKYVDLLIPRGSSRLIQYCVENAQVPMIETGAGVCHLFVDKDYNKQMAESILINAKTSRTSVCNSIESLLLHRNISLEDKVSFLKLLEEHNVEIYGDDEVIKIYDNAQPIRSYSEEYLDLKISVKIVDSIEEAVSHINEYGTRHSEIIVSESKDSAQYFRNHVDAAVIYHNVSSRFTDGFEFGLGAEIGISTQKMHARGPMGLQELTTYTYYVEGNGQVR